MIETQANTTRSSHAITGVFPVLPTPFDKALQPDIASLRCLVRYLLCCGVDGMTFLKLVRSMFKEQPPPQAIVVTGQGSMALVVEAMRGDAVDFLSKPATGSELLSAVARAEERWRASTGSSCCPIWARRRSKAGPTWARR